MRPPFNYVSLKKALEVKRHIYQAHVTILKTQFFRQTLHPVKKIIRQWFTIAGWSFYSQRFSGN